MVLVIGRWEAVDAPAKCMSGWVITRRNGGSVTFPDAKVLHKLFRQSVREEGFGRMSIMMREEDQGVFPPCPRKTDGACMSHSDWAGLHGPPDFFIYILVVQSYK